MKILPTLLTALAIMAGSGHAASVLNFNTGTANAVTGDPLPFGVSLSLDYAYLETHDAQGDLLTRPSWLADATAGSVQLVADHITIPGAIISGKVSFSDGQMASWHMDQTGRLSLTGAPKDYQPPAADIPLFQQQLDMLMQRAGI